MDHAVLVLACAVVGVQVNLLFTQAMMLKEVVDSADDSIRAFATVSGFISKEVHLLRKCLTVHTPNTVHFLGVRK